MRGLLIAVIALTALPILAQDEARYEIGIQFATIDLRSSVGEKPAGIGGRFGYNLTKWLTAESEINHFPQDPSGNFGETMALFGPKIGHRFFNLPHFGDMGIFLKARPGLIHFDSPYFEERGAGDRTKFACDVGVAWEQYFKEIGFFRIDIGDVVIPFGNAVINPGSIIERHPRTTHNFYGTIGVGVRF